MAARAMWKGVLVGKGLKLPVKLYAAVEDRAVRFHLLHGRAKQRVEQRLVDPDEGEAVPAEEVRKGYEVEPGVFVVLDHEDLAGLEPEPTRDVELVDALPAGTIDQAYYDRPYWLGPDGDDDAYFALAEALANQEREGLVRWVMRKRPYVGALRAQDGYLSLVALRHAGEVVLTSSISAPAGRDLDAREMKLAEQLVDALADHFDPDLYRDTYRERVEELIEAKAAGRRPKLAKLEPRKETASLEKALAASLAKTAKRGAGGEGDEGGKGAAKPKARKPAARRAKPARKTARKPAKKAAARKKPAKTARRKTSR